MTRKILGLSLALLLAVAGTVALVAYVQSAEDRALSDEQLVEVLVASRPIVAGTLGSEMGDSVGVARIPAKVKAEGAIATLDDVAEFVVSIDLLPGEQLVVSRFVPLTAFTERNPGLVIPEDVAEVTIELDASRAVGGLLRPGQTVAVIASYEPFDKQTQPIETLPDGSAFALPQSVAGGSDSKTPNVTETIIRKALVTAVAEVEGGGFESGPDRASARLDQAPEDPVLVTLALPLGNIEQVVFAMEFGTVWLAREQPTTPDGDGPFTEYNEALGNEEG